MLVSQLLSTTGVFEYAVVNYIIPRSKRSIWRLCLLLCLATAILSAMLDNVTIMLLLAPVTIEICEVLKLDPIPFLVRYLLPPELHYFQI